MGRRQAQYQWQTHSSLATQPVCGQSSVPAVLDCKRGSVACHPPRLDGATRWSNHRLITWAGQRSHLIADCSPCRASSAICRLQRRTCILFRVRQRNNHQLHLQPGITDGSLWQQGGNWCVRPGGSLPVIWQRCSLHGTIYDRVCLWFKVCHC